MKETLKNIVSNFPITNEEYEQLDKKFGKLCYFAAWQLRRKNSQNYFSKDPDCFDESQDLRMALIRAGSYYKRQTYIEASFEALRPYVDDTMAKKVLARLEALWEDRRRHGANRQKFGSFHEEILDRLLKTYVPSKERPQKDAMLKIDSKFSTYCKQIVWNAQKSIGKKITRDKSFTTGLVSLSEYDYLAQNTG